MMFGMPTEMFAVFAATILAGSLGAIHYVIVHVILKRPFGDEETRIERRDPTSRVTAARSKDEGKGGKGDHHAG
jgi:hypothetical protein